MNYLTVISAKTKLSDYEESLSKIKEEIKFSFLSSAFTESNFQDRSEQWKVITTSIEITIKNIEKDLSNLKNVEFETGTKITQEVDKLITEYNDLLIKFYEERGKLVQQTREEKPLEIYFFPQLKKINPNHCYFCDRIITDFPYKIPEERQTIIGVEINPEAEFCSKECLLNYCREFESGEKVRQNRYKKIEQEIENNENKVNELTVSKTKLLKELNDLNLAKLKLENQLENKYRTETKIGFWKGLGIKWGLVKDDDPITKLKEIKDQIRKKNFFLNELESKLQRKLRSLLVDKQEKQKLNKKMLSLGKEKSD